MCVKILTCSHIKHLQATVCTFLCMCTHTESPSCFLKIKKMEKMLSEMFSENKNYYR